MNKVVMILGPPASGKSTKSNEYIKQDFVYLNRDKLGGKILDLVSKLEAALKASSNVLLDNLFPTKAIRKPFIDLCKQYNVEIECIHIDTSIEDCQINALNRMYERYKTIFHHSDDIKKHTKAKNDPNIFPPVVLFKYRKEFESPSMTEGFSRIEIRSFERTQNKKYTNKALILDYDDTLRKSNGKNPFPIHVDEVEILPNRKNKLREYKSLGYILLGVSNQSGVAKGIFSLEDAKKCFERTNQLLGFDIDYCFCPHQAAPPVCYCRKPQTSNGVHLIHKYKLNPADCIFVGDATSDKSFANRLGFQYKHPKEFFNE